MKRLPGFRYNHLLCGCEPELRKTTAGHQDADRAIVSIDYSSVRLPQCTYYLPLWFQNLPTRRILPLAAFDDEPDVQKWFGRKIRDEGGQRFHHQTGSLTSTIREFRRLNRDPVARPAEATLSEDCMSRLLSVNDGDIDIIHFTSSVASGWELEDTAEGG